MQIDIANFTPWSSLLGGMIIGLAAALLIVFNGRIAGISGIVGALLTKASGWVWRLCFVIGLLIAPTVWKLASLPALHPHVVSAPLWYTLLAGLLVGFGTQMGSGCTSGHGVCGLARLSLRSLVATLCFMIAAFITVFLVHHLGA